MIVTTLAIAFDMGYKSAQAGEAVTANPYKEFANTSAAWVKGWVEGNNLQPIQMPENTRSRVNENRSRNTSSSS